jgi:hypothetical protein
MISRGVIASALREAIPLQLVVDRLTIQNTSQADISAGPPCVS